jgi:hypothetical protein
MRPDVGLKGNQKSGRNWLKKLENIQPQSRSCTITQPTGGGVHREESDLRSFINGIFYEFNRAAGTKKSRFCKVGMDR